MKEKKDNLQTLLNILSEVKNIDVRVKLIQELIPIGLLYVQEAFEYEITQLVGNRYKRNSNYYRWGKQKGSVYLGEQKVPVYVPRVRNKKGRMEVNLRTYELLKRPRKVNTSAFKKVLYGISGRRYREAVKTIPEVFGLSKAAVSRKYIKVSTQKLKEIVKRRLDNYDIVAVVILNLFQDVKRFKGDEIIVALGITREGEKVILGFVQSSPENGRVYYKLLLSLLNRGLKLPRYRDGALYVIDRSKMG